ncbi:acyl carrier protein [Wenzhouxiangella sp. XN79A]|uniref:acyl carrier protein n=1 Tax=Wenzhouxiangella sp. XN79A TaxID=2724193 RepID=UPI00144A5467|nr:acyl carrier protein [Wenzhouxiangella sp. XN79A]NKI36000.1 acyl carrier protein [Wenzhouxiangella sp. XN79A]
MTDARTDIHQAIQDAVAVSLPQLGTVDFDAVLTSEIGLDSVQIMDLVMEIEDRLDVSIPVEVLAEARTLNELAGRIEPLCKDGEA